MHSCGEFEQQQIRQMLAGYYQDKELAVKAEHLSRYYSVEQVRWILDNPDANPVILIFEEDPAIARFLQENLAGVADIIHVSDRNRVDTVCDRQIHRVRLVLASGLREKDDLEPDVMWEDLIHLRSRFPGFILSPLPEAPDPEIAFLFGKAGLDGWITPRSRVSQHVQTKLAFQNEVMRNLRHPNWFGLVCACLEAGSINRIGWPGALECLHEIVC